MKKILVIALCLMFLPRLVLAQPSLAAENTIDDITVTTKYGKQKVYSVFRDAVIEDQWYYMPNELRLAEEIDVNKKVRPKLTILEYQYQDVTTKTNKEGGILVAAFTYAIEPEVVESVKSQIQEKQKTKTWWARSSKPANIRLAAIPLISSTIDFLSDSEEFIGKVDAKALNASGATTASQEMVLSFNLTALGAGVFSALISGNGGIPIRGNISYNGLTPPCGYSIRGKWDDVYKYFEENKLYEGRFNFWVVSGGGSSSKNTVKESLQSIKGMDVKVIECSNEGGTNTSDQANMEALITKIQEEVFSTNLLTHTTELAKLTEMLKGADPSTAEKIQELILKEKNSIQAGYQKSVKNISRRRTGLINYDFSRQQMRVRNTTLGGLLGLSKYFPEGCDKAKLVAGGYIVQVDANKDFPSVIVGLPNLNPGFDLKSLLLEVSYKNSDGNTISEARQWDSTKGWITIANKEVGYMRFNLIGEKNQQQLEEPVFKVKMQVISKIPNASFVIERDVKLSRGEKFIDALELLTQQYMVDASGLDFRHITKDEADLAFAKVIFNKGNVTISKDLKPYFVDGNPTPPPPLYLLVPKEDSAETSRIIFTTNRGKKVELKDMIALGDNTLVNEWKNELPQ